MNEVDYMNMCEAQAFGEYLLEVISDIYACDPTPQAITEAVYECTEFGAWCEFTETGITVGTIVEGSDAEFSTDVTLSDDPKELTENFLSAIAECERFAEGNFRGF